MTLVPTQPFAGQFSAPKFTGGNTALSFAQNLFQQAQNYDSHDRFDYSGPHRHKSSPPANGRFAKAANSVLNFMYNPDAAGNNSVGAELGADEPKFHMMA